MEEFKWGEKLEKEKNLRDLSRNIRKRRSERDWTHISFGFSTVIQQNKYCSTLCYNIWTAIKCLGSEMSENLVETSIPCLVNSSLMDCHVLEVLVICVCWLLTVISSPFHSQLVKYNNDRKQEDLECIWPWWFWQGEQLYSIVTAGYVYMVVL